VKIVDAIAAHDYLERLKKALSELKQVQIGDEQVSLGLDPGYDAILTLSLPDGDYQLQLIIKTLAEPSRVKAWLGERPKAASNAARVYQVLAAPFLSDEAIKLCSAQGVGAVDLEGNLSLVVGGVSLRHSVTARKGKGPAGLALPERSLSYAGVQRVAIGLLEGGRGPWRMQDLATHCKASMGQVFKVSQWLVSQAWAEKPARGQFKLTEPEALLDALAKAYEPKGQKTFRYFSLADQREIENTLAVRAQMVQQSIVLASFSAARAWAPFVRHLRAQFYIQGRPQDIAASTSITMEPAEKGSNIFLTIPENDTPFVFAQQVGDRYATGLIQTYLDLLREPLRGEEAAEKVRERWLENYNKGELSRVV
jgi:hypothetical protein